MKQEKIETSKQLPATAEPTDHSALVWPVRLFLCVELIIYGLPCMLITGQCTGDCQPVSKRGYLISAVFCIAPWILGLLCSFVFPRITVAFVLGAVVIWLATAWV